MKQFVKNVLITGSILAVAASTNAAVSVTNGDFEEGSPTGNSMDVLSWFDANQNGQSDSAWWLSTWYGPVVSPTGSSVMGLSWSSPSWAYQNIGVNDSGLDVLEVTFDLGSFTDAGGPRDIGIMLNVYQEDGTFAAADDADIDGAAGVTLIGSGQTHQLLDPGTFQTVSVYVDLSPANPANDLWLRFINFDAGADNPWAAIDNVSVTTVVPEPTTLALAGLGMAALLFKRRQR